LGYHSIAAREGDGAIRVKRDINALIVAFCDGNQGSPQSGDV
jgi:hypothetical protein